MIIKLIMHLKSRKVIYFRGGTTGFFGGPGTRGLSVSLLLPEGGHFGSFRGADGLGGAAGEWSITRLQVRTVPRPVAG